ncbi:MAG: DUF1150 family protein [Albidovulum sp.]|nr:DUF1150 family protein [Albidovulum sp.]MDE0534384.1 DUF1150 family protein [Albidovulum sp.]
MERNPPVDFGNLTRTVYVRPVEAEDLPDDIREQISDSKEMFALHDSAGQRIAVVSDRRIAFAVARRNDFSPVHVH